MPEELPKVANWRGPDRSIHEKRFGSVSVTRKCEVLHFVVVEVRRAVVIAFATTGHISLERAIPWAAAAPHAVEEKRNLGRFRNIQVPPMPAGSPALQIIGRVVSPVVHAVAADFVAGIASLTHDVGRVDAAKSLETAAGTFSALSG